MAQERSRVLIVDEEEAVARALSFLLEREGFEVHLASGEDRALEGARTLRPDAVLLEVTTRGPAALVTLARLKAEASLAKAAVILVTSRSKPRDVVAGLERGADDYILKPFDPKEVVARIRAQVRIRRLQDQLVEAERWRVLLETAGAVAHEMSQPLTAIMGNLELMLQRMAKDDPQRHLAIRMFENGERAVLLLRKLQRIDSYELKSYTGTAKILDIERSSRG